MANNELRQAVNNVTLTGEVKEHKLKFNKDKDGNYINGSLIIKTGEFSELEVKIFAKEKNKDGKIKKVFETLNKFIDGEQLTLADCKNDEDRENVTKVRIFGNKDFVPHFKEEIFKIKESEEVKTKITIELGFGNVSIDNGIKPEDYKADFDVEMYVTSIKEEIKNDEETGRTIISGWTPVYGGKVIPMEFVAGTIIDDEGEEYDFGADVLNSVEEGMTLNLWGNINYQSKIVKTKKGGTLGKAKIEEHREYVNELIVLGADIQEDEEKEFDPELVKKAKIERDNEIENKKNEESTDKKGKGLGNKGAGANITKRERPKF